LIVIGDVKRGDIGTLLRLCRCASGRLAFDSHETIRMPDAITVNPCSAGHHQPFHRGRQDLWQGPVHLVRTSNPGSADLQDVALADGRTWSESLADSSRHRG